MNNIKRIIALILVLLLSFSMFAGCSSTGTDVFSIDGENVSWELYRYYYLNLKYQYDSGKDSYWENNNYAKDKLKEDVLYYIKRDFAIDNIAADLNITLSEDELADVDTSIEEIKAMLGGEEQYQKFLTSCYTDADMYYELVKRDALGQKIWDVLFGENGTKTISDSEMIAKIKEEYVRAYHVLITFETEDAKELAQFVADKAKKGEDFNGLIKAYGEDPGMTSNTDGYYFTKGEMVAEFEKAAFALKIDEISDPVMSTYGYHIIKRMALDDSYINENLADLKENYYNISTSQMIQEYMDALEVKELSQYRKVNIDMK